MVLEIRLFSVIDTELQIRDQLHFYSGFTKW